MKSITNECVGCVNMGLYCLGNGCPNRNVERFYCDKCGSEEKLYIYEGSELCESCLLKNFEIVEGSEW